MCWHEVSNTSKYRPAAAPKQTGSAMSNFLFLILLSNVFWFVSVASSLEHALMACAGILLIFAVIQSWKFICLAAILGGAGWVMMKGSTFFNFVIADLFGGIL